jgi:hypothetical protein
VRIGFLYFVIFLSRYRFRAVFMLLRKFLLGAEDRERGGRGSLSLSFAVDQVVEVVDEEGTAELAIDVVAHWVV